MKSHRRLLSLLAALLVIGGGVLFLWRTGFFDVRSLNGMQRYIDRFSPYSQLVYFLVQLASVILAPIPSNLTAAAGGMLFGAWPAFLLTFAAVTVGSLLVFWLARVLGQSFADRVVSRRLSEKYQDVIRSKTSVFLTLAFLFPYFPDDVLCILAGLTDIPLRRFLIIVLLARPWGLLFACFLGGASFTFPLWALVLAGIAGAACFVLGLKYADRLEAAVLARLRRQKP